MKFIKKINCIILVLCMITASFADIVFAADSTGGIIVSENYENGNEFSFENGYITDSGIKGMGKSLCINVPDSDNAVITSTFFSEKLSLLDSAGGNGFNAVTSFDILFNDIVENGGTVSMLLTSSNMVENYDDRTSFLRMEFNGADKAINTYYFNGSQQICKKVADLADNKAYRIRILTEVTDKYGYKLSRHRSISINGAEVVSKQAYTSINAEKLPYYDVLQLWALESAGEKILLDNIEVRKYNISDNTVNRDLLISQIRKADEMVNVYTGYYSADNIATLKTAETAAESVYENLSASQSEVNNACSALQKVIADVEAESVHFRAAEDFENGENTLFENAEIVTDETIGIGNAARLTDSCVNSSDFEKSPLFTKGVSYSAAEDGAECFVETEYDVHIDSKKSSSSAIIALTSDEMVTKYNDTTGFFKMAFNGNGKAVLYHSDTSGGFVSKETHADFDLGNWNRIRIVAQITDKNSYQLQCIKAVYLNGIAVLENTNFTSVNTNKLPYYNKVQIRLADCNMYLDNFTVKKYNKTENAAVAKDLLISQLREKYYGAKSCTVGDEAGEYSEERVSNYIKALYDIYSRCGKPSVTDDDMQELFNELEKAKSLFVPNDSQTVVRENFETSSTLFPTAKTETSSVYGTGTTMGLFANGTDSSAKFGAVVPSDGFYTELEFDFMLKNTAGSKAQAKILGFFNNLIIDGAGGKLILEDNNGKRSDICNVANDKWYRINLIYSNKEISAYIDGECRLTQSAEIASDSFEDISIKRTDFENSGLFIDNIAVRKGSENSEIKSLSESAKISAVRNAEKWLKKYSNKKGSEEYANLENAYERAMLYNEEPEVIGNCIEMILDNEDYFELNYQGLRNKNGEYETDFKDASEFETVSVVKNTKKALSVNIAVAMYDASKELKLIKSERLSLSEGSDTVTKPFPINISDEMSEAKIYVWNDDMLPYMNVYSTDMPVESSDNWTVYLNNTKVRSDAEPILYNNGELMMLSSNLVNWFGAALEQHGDTYSAEREDGRYISFVSGTSEINVNGKIQKTSNTIAPYQGTYPLISAYSAAEAFGGSVNVNKSAKTITVINDYTEENHRIADNSSIITEGGNGWAKYAIPNISPNADVEVWVRFSECNMPSLGNFLTSDGNWKSGYKNNSDNSMITFWRKLYKPRYENGAFRGSIGGLWTPSRKYDIKVKVTENGNSDVFVVKEAFKTKTDVFTSMEDSAISTGQDLVLKSTFENIGYYIDEQDSLTSCEVFFRVKGDNTWNEAYEPYYDNTVHQYRGSIVKLKSGTEYEVKAVIKDTAGNTIREVVKTAKTWADDVPVAKTVKLSDIYSGSGALVIDGFKGTENGWIKIDGEGAVLDAEKNTFEAVFISDSQYVILENLTVKGGYRCGINVTGGSENIRIKKCDISGWGRVGILDKTIGNYIADGETVNYDAGIRLYDVSKVTVENCTIHDADAFTNAWNSDDWSWVHPAGASGIFCRVNEGLVIRYNNIAANDIHRWNDGIESMVNGYREGGLGHDSDIYGNIIAFCQDDGMEVDGSGMNVRIYQNRIENGLCGISTAPVESGPLYIYENLITNMGTLNGDVNSMIKSSASYDGVGGTVYVFNNTFDSVEPGIVNTSSDTNYITRNNIIAARRINGMALKNNTNISGSNDYDMLSKLYEVCSGDEKNGISGIPQYRNFDFGDFYPADNFKGIDKGQFLNNFSVDRTVGSAPDMGALEYGGEMEFLPYRPIKARADRYYVEVHQGAEETVNITSDEPIYLDNKLLPEWIDAVGYNTENGLCIKLSAKSDTNANGMIFVVNQDGYKLPITLKGIK